MKSWTEQKEDTALDITMKISIFFCCTETCTKISIGFEQYGISVRFMVIPDFCLWDMYSLYSKPIHHKFESFTKKKISFRISYFQWIRSDCNTISTKKKTFFSSYIHNGLPISDESLTCNVCDRAFHCHRQLASHQQKKRHFG